MRFSSLLAVVVASAGLTVATEAHEPCAAVTATVTVTVDSCKTAPSVMPPSALPTSSVYVPPVEPSAPTPPTGVPGVPPTTVASPAVGTTVSTTDTSLPSKGLTTETASEPTAPITTGPHRPGTPTNTAPAQETTNAAPMIGLDFDGMGVIAAGILFNAAMAPVA